MKISIMDLMDHYYGGPVVRLDPPRPADMSASMGRRTERQRHGKPLAVAAALLLVVTGAAALRLGVLRQTASGNALSPGAESGWETFSVPAAVSDTDPEDSAETFSVPAAASAEEDQAEITASIQDQPLVEPQILAGQPEDSLYSCEGNMLYVGGTYYTITENGPEPLETQRLHTTVELYGSWEVDIDYAVVDGELVFHDNTSTEAYTLINGEIVTQSEYHDADMSEAVTRTEPTVASAFSLEGSGDTVILRIFRTDIASVDRAAYIFLYNIFTGEISDPLANVPELFDHGSFATAVFNPSATRAIVNTFGADGYMDTYICDLLTGEMVSIDDLAAPYLPQSDTASFAARNDYCVWANDDTLLFWIQERTDNGSESGWTEDGEYEYISAVDYYFWLCSYNMAEESMRYQLRDVTLFVLDTEQTHAYIHSISEDDGLFQVIDTAAGTQYYMDNPLTACGWSETADRAVIYEDAETIYFIDDTHSAWGNLAEYLLLPDEEVLSTRLITDDWLCLVTESAVYCYRIPEDIAMTPLMEK